MTHLVFFAAILLVNTDKHMELMKEDKNKNHNQAHHDEHHALYLNLLEHEQSDMYNGD